MTLCARLFADLGALFFGIAVAGVNGKVGVFGFEAESFSFDGAQDFTLQPQLSDVRASEHIDSIGACAPPIGDEQATINTGIAYLIAMGSDARGFREIAFADVAAKTLDMAFSRMALVFAAEESDRSA